jgi:hypothetical protein
MLLRVLALASMLTPTIGDVAPVTTSAPRSATATPRAVEWPAHIRTGERLVYDVKFSAIKVGTGTMEAIGVETIRGRPAMHVKFEVRGGTLFYRVHDILESWIDTTGFFSLRHRQDYNEGGRNRDNLFEFFPERNMFQRNGGADEPMVDAPLDEGSFLYFVRTIPLEVGRTYEFNRYFRPDRNPVRIIVKRKERIKVPAGQFDAIVIQPIIKARGLFSEGGRAEIWLADDSTRAMLQMKSSLPIGSLNLYLRSGR